MHGAREDLPLNHLYMTHLCPTDPSPAIRLDVHPAFHPLLPDKSKTQVDLGRLYLSSPTMIPTDGLTE